MNRNFDGQKLIEESIVSNPEIETEMLKEPFHSFFANVSDSLEVTESNHIKIQLETDYASILDAENFANATKEAETCIRSSDGLVSNLHKRMLRGWSEAALEFANYLLDYLLYNEDICFDNQMSVGININRYDKGFTAEMIIKLYEKDRHSDELTYQAAKNYLDFYSYRNNFVHVKSKFDRKRKRYLATHRSYPTKEKVIDAVELYKNVLKKIDQKINIS